MINPGAVQNRSPYLRILTDDQICEIKRAAFDVLWVTGFKLFHKGARKMLKQAGAVVRDDHVRLPEHIILECLRTAPKGFTVFDRDGDRAMEVEGRKVYFGTSPASPNTKDALTGEVHRTRVDDIAVAAQVADALPNIDWVMPMGSVQDVPPLAADLYEFQAVVNNTTKPVVFIGYSARGAELAFEMAAEIAGGMDELRQKPFAILYPEPITPLICPEEVVDRIFVAADLMMPQIPGPAVQMGATGPMTLAGTIVQITAEALMCIVLAQLRRPGCPVCMSGNVQVLDMRSSLVSVGAPELSLGISAQAEVARSFGLPTWGYAGCSDSKLVDAQAGLEAGFSCLAQALAGLNLVHDVGYLDSGMICSPAQLVLGNEAAGMAKRFVEGIRIDRESLAREVIQAVGPGGHFLTQRHTLDNFKKELWRSDLLVKEGWETWQARGGKDTAGLIQDRLRQIIETHSCRPLPDKTRQALDRLRKEGEKELAARGREERRR